MDDAKQQLAEKLKSANNVLVTVSRDPTVDQLAALLGLGLYLNKQGKHCAAVFSGQIPSTLEFLSPEETIEKTTDSLRDFIIALDKNKADKLRYKVEDNIVRIFITPYRTSITEDDLDFSQGDFNVDVVVAIGVVEQNDLDEAVTAYGRILHDATVTSINLSADGGLGSINWHVPEASSLSELVTGLIQVIDKEQLDEQIATALLTGIVSATDRFSNNKTSSQTMSLAADLMNAGANQQLVATKLEEEAVPISTTTEADHKDGTLQIDHKDEVDEDKSPDVELPTLLAEDNPEVEQPKLSDTESSLMTEPPALGGTLTANSSLPKLDPVTDPFSLPETDKPELLEHKADPVAPADTEPAPPAAASWVPPTFDQPSDDQTLKPSTLTDPDNDVQTIKPTVSSPDNNDDQTLTDIEGAVGSPHIKPGEDASVARDEVDKALADSGSPPPPPPIAALNAQPLGPDLHPALPPPPTPPDDTAMAKQSLSSPSGPPPVPPPLPFDFSKPAK